MKNDRSSEKALKRKINKIRIKTIKLFREDLQKKLSYIGVSIVVLFLFLVALSDPEIKLIPIKKEKKADFIFEKVTITQSIEGIKKWKIYSDEAQINKDNHEAKLNKVTGVFYENDEPVFSLEAPSAKVNLETSNIKLKDSKSIILFKEDPVNILAESLTWDASARQFIATGNVELLSGDLNMKGKKFIVDLNTKKINLNQSEITINEPNGDSKKDSETDLEKKPKVRDSQNENR